MGEWKPQNEEIKFTVIFRGDSTENHTINAADLASSLSGISDLLLQANDTLNGSKSTVSVKVYGSPKAGSFEFDIITNITGAVLISLVNTVDIIGLTGKTVENAIGHINTLIDLIRTTNGKPIETVRPINDDSVEISISDSPNTFIVNNSVIKIYNETSCRRGIEKVLTPLLRKGVESASFASSGSIPETVTRDQVSAFIAPDSEPFCMENNVALFVITRADYYGRTTGWRFSLNLSGGRNDFPAEVLDENFLQDVVSSRARVSQGTIIRAKYEMTQERKERIITKWRIHRVFEIYSGESEDYGSREEWGVVSNDRR